MIVGGWFDIAGDVDVSNIAAWDGESWSPLGTGLDGPVNHMVVYDDGNGPSLYVTGNFETAGGKEAGGFARWDGSQWHAVGSLSSSSDNWAAGALAVHDGKLIIGSGVFTYDNYKPGPIAVYDGRTWSSWEAGSQFITAVSLTSFDDGTGSSVYAGTITSPDIPSLFKWDSQQWTIPHGGISEPNESASVNGILAMAVSSDGSQLAVSGSFSQAGDVSSGSIAILHGCPPILIGDLNGDGVVNVLDLIILLDAWGPCPDPNDADCPADLNGDGEVNVLDLLILLENWG